MKRLNAALLVLGVLFLGWLVLKSGLRELGRELVGLGWGLIPFILGEGVAEMIHTVAWRYCLSGPLRALPWHLLFRIRLAGYSINYLTPSAALGGEVSKVALLSARYPGPAALTGVLIDKLAFGCGHLLFVLLGSALVVWRVSLPRSLWMAMLLSSASVGVGIVAFLLLQIYGKLGVLIRWLADRHFGGQFLQKLAHKLTAVDDALKLFYRERPWDLVLAIAWHLLGYSVGIAQTWLFFHLLHLPASLVMAATVWFLGMWFDLLTFAVPLNLGTLEGSRMLAFRALGYGAVVGLTYGVALRLAMLSWAVLGLLGYAFLNARSASKAREDSIHRTGCESSC